uniref:BRO1 domain-containing protein n=1 Tax=Schistocephalus solidus TaxID=70667 RepID=A0A183SNE5_SCHSO
LTQLTLNQMNRMFKIVLALVTRCGIRVRFCPCGPPPSQPLPPRRRLFLRAVPRPKRSPWRSSKGCWLLPSLTFEQLGCSTVNGYGDLLGCPSAALFDTVNDLFERKQPAALALEAFWKSSDAYVRALQELALRAFPDESPDQCENEYVYLRKVLDVARGYEAAGMAHRQPASTHNFSVSQLIPSNRRPPSHPVHRRQVPPASCPYYRRFGRRAQHCGHNPPIRPQPSPGRSIFNAVSLPSLAVISRNACPPLTIPGTLNGHKLFFLLVGGADDLVQLVMPRTKVHDTFNDIHSPLGNVGQSKTEAAIVSYCHSCLVCGQLKSPVPALRALLQLIAADGPNQKISVDIMGPLSNTRRGNQLIIVIIDYFTMWCEVIPYNTKKQG